MESVNELGGWHSRTIMSSSWFARIGQNFFYKYLKGIFDPRNSSLRLINSVLEEKLIPGLKLKMFNKKKTSRVEINSFFMGKIDSRVEIEYFS